MLCEVTVNATLFFHQLDVLSQRRCVDESAQDQQNKDCAG